MYDPNSYATTNNYGPYRPAYLGNQIPVSEFNPYSLAFIKAVFGNATPSYLGIATTDRQLSDHRSHPPNRYITTLAVSTSISAPRTSSSSAIPEFSGLRCPSTVPTLFTSTQIPAQQYGVSWVHVFSPTTSMQVQYGRTHVEDDTLTQFNNHNLWQVYGCSVDMCNSFVGGAAVLVTQTLQMASPEARSTVHRRTCRVSMSGRAV